jgi:hypothetical protein
MLQRISQFTFIEDSIIYFADIIGIHRGIVVGRLQNDKYIGFHQIII